MVLESGFHVIPPSLVALGRLYRGVYFAVINVVNWFVNNRLRRRKRWS
jgi:hypothetical protein